MRILLVLPMSLISFGLLAQLAMPGARTGGVRPFDQYVVSDWARNTKKTVPKYVGSPYLFEEWAPADLVTIKDQVFEDIQVKYDVYQQYLMYKPLNSRDSLIIQDGLIERFSIKAKDTVYRFEKYLLPVEKQTGAMNDFFVVLDSGRYILLAQPSKRLQETSAGALTKASSDDMSRFVDDVFYYIRRPDRRVMEIRPSKKHRKSIFGTDHARITAFANEHRLSWKKRGDLKEIVRFANEL
ncbi:MAG: hypothetical protein AAGA85_23575 [Bacteroidota bacterium]